MGYYEKKMDELYDLMYQEEEISEQISSVKNALTDAAFCHTEIHSQGIDKSNMLERLFSEHKTGVSAFYSEEDQWYAIRDVIDSRSEKIAEWLTYADNQSRYTICDKVLSYDTEEGLGDGFIRDDNGFLRKFTTKYITMVLERDVSMPYGFKIITAYPGNKNFTPQILNLGDEEVSNEVHKTEYFKKSSPEEKTYLDYISNPKHSYAAKLNRYNGEISIILIQKCVTKRNNKIVIRKDAHVRAFIDRDTCMVTKYQDTPDIGKSHWKPVTYNLATEFYGKPSASLNLSIPKARRFFEQKSNSFAATIFAIQESISKYISVDSHSNTKTKSKSKSLDDELTL